MSPMRSPSEITIERLSKSFRTPNVLLMFWQLMSDMRSGLIYQEKWSSCPIS